MTVPELLQNETLPDEVRQALLSKLSQFEPSDLHRFMTHAFVDPKTLHEVSFTEATAFFGDLYAEAGKGLAVNPSIRPILRQILTEMMQDSGNRLEATFITKRVGVGAVATVARIAQRDEVSTLPDAPNTQTLFQLADQIAARPKFPEISSELISPDQLKEMISTLSRANKK